MKLLQKTNKHRGCGGSRRCNTGWMVCDSEPASVYYHGTDMSVEELIAHLKNTNVIDEPETVDGETYFVIEAPTGETIPVYFYENRADILEQVGRHFRPMDKAHIFNIPSFKYELVKDSF